MKQYIVLELESAHKASQLYDFEDREDAVLKRECLIKKNKCVSIVLEYAIPQI